MAKNPYQIIKIERKRRRAAASYRIRIVNGKTEFVPNLPPKTIADAIKGIEKEIEDDK